LRDTVIEDSNKIHSMFSSQMEMTKLKNLKERRNQEKIPELRSPNKSPLRRGSSLSASKDSRLDTN